MSADDWLSGDKSSDGSECMPLEDDDEMLPTSLLHAVDTCPYCHQTYRQPRLLHCLHALCEDCIVAQLERRPDHAHSRRARAKLGNDECSLENDQRNKGKQAPGVIRCPTCNQDSQVGNDVRFIGNLLVDYVTRNTLDARAINEQRLDCESCKHNERATARCKHCNKFICENCVKAHQFMTCFDGHTVVTFDAMRASAAGDVLMHRPINCLRHHHEELQYACATCHKTVCQTCVQTEHKPADSHRIHAVDANTRAVLADELNKVIVVAQKKVDSATSVTNNSSERMEALRCQVEAARENVQQAFDSFKDILEEHRTQMLNELDTLHSRNELHMNTTFDMIARTSEKVNDACRFAHRLLQHGSAMELLQSRSTVLTQISSLVNSMPIPSTDVHLRYVGTADQFRNAMYGCCGHFDTNERARLTSMTASMSKDPVLASCMSSDVYSHGQPINNECRGAPPPTQQQHAAAAVATPYASGSQPATGAPLLYGGEHHDLQLAAAMATLSTMNTSEQQRQHADQQAAALAYMSAQQQSMPAMKYVWADTSAPLPPIGHKPLTVSPKESSRSTFWQTAAAGGYHSTVELLHKFGTLGNMQGQFNSPHGFCLGFDDEIVIADTNNHRIQVFNAAAKFVRVFGASGKDDGQLWYPRKVAILQMREHRYYIICDRGNERSRMQIFTSDGNYVKKIAIRFVDIVAGLAVDSDLNIVAVDSVSPTVFVIDVETSELKRWFDCSAYMKEPSDIAVHKDKYYICDFKGHCVCVFAKDGGFVTKFGGEGITSFPNGIDVSPDGDILIGDSHGNKFHVSIFDSRFQFVQEYDCPNLKVSRCCGLRVTGDGLIITLAKNNHYAIVLKSLTIPAK